MLICQLSLKTPMGDIMGVSSQKHQMKQCASFRDTHIPPCSTSIRLFQPILHSQKQYTLNSRGIYCLPFEELKKGDFYERYITPKWYPEIQAKKYAGNLTYIWLGVLGKSSGIPVLRLFSCVKIPHYLSPRLLQANDDIFTGLIKKWGRWDFCNVFSIQLNISIWKNVLYSKFCSSFCFSYKMFYFKMMAITRIFVLCCSCLANKIQCWIDLSVITTIILCDTLPQSSAAYNSKHLFLVTRLQIGWAASLYVPLILPGPLDNWGHVLPITMAQQQEQRRTSFWPKWITWLSPRKGGPSVGPQFGRRTTLHIVT